MRTPLARRVAAYAALTAAAVVVYGLQSTRLALFPPGADGFLFGLSISLSVGLVVWPALAVALKNRAVPVVAALLLAAGATAQSTPGAGAGDLPRRALFGAHIAPAENGVGVQALSPGASAEAAGLRPGDVVVEADGASVPDPPAFLAALAEAGAGADWPLRVVRDGEAIEVTVALQEAPRLSSPGLAVEYGAVSADGALRRAIATVPPGDGPRPAVLLVGGVGCYSLDSPAPHPYHRLREALGAAGYLTLWVEKSGMGDSQGTPCPEIDFDAELAGYRAGLRALQDRPDVSEVFLFGHSMGGLIGPLLAAEAAEAGTPLAGLVAVSTAGLPWFEYTLANLRRQLPLMGLGPAQVDATMRQAVRANAAVFLDGRDPAEVAAEHPSWAGFLQLPQHVSYMRQVASYDPAAVWAAADAPVLLIAGGADFVSSPTEHERLQAVVERERPGTADYVLLDDLDHFVNRVPDAEASFRTVSSGQPYQSFHDGLSETVVTWLDDQR